MKSWKNRDNSNINEILSWPPGTLMIYDNAGILPTYKSGCTHPVTGQYVPNPDRDPNAHFGRGIVVANDGVDTIKVLWDAGCKQRLCTYSVRQLNQRVIRRGQ